MGIYDETLVIYMGDNGYMFGEHGLIDKRVAYETSSRVPMLMQCPAIIPGGHGRGRSRSQHRHCSYGDGCDGGEEAIRTWTARASFPWLKAQSIPWRDYFLYVLLLGTELPTNADALLACAAHQYKYTTYYGLWDTDELFDISVDPEEQNNLIHDPAFARIKQQMQSRLYEMMDDLGGMEIPMNPPRGRQQNKRLRNRGGVKAADFPDAFIVDEPLREIK